MDTVNIAAEAIRELAKRHPGAAEDIKALCPDVFVDPGPFEFQREHHLSAATSGYPLFIGNSYAPDSLRMRYLVVHRDCRMEIREHDGRTLLVLYPK